MSVTAQKIADALYGSAKGETDERVRKAQRRAEQYQIAWADVEALRPTPVTTQSRKRKAPAKSRVLNGD